MSIPRKGVPVIFGPGMNTTSIVNSDIKNHWVYLYTESGGKAVRNHCTACDLPYYSMMSVVSSSIASVDVKVCRCSHSKLIGAYVRRL
jgi:hypothetical protein